jgi:hypothetical protein
MLGFSTTARNALCSSIIESVGDGAFLRIYDGVRPVSVDTAISTQILLCELQFDTPFAGIPNMGVVTSNQIIGDENSNSSGNAVWFRIYRSDGTTAVIDGDVGVNGSDLNLSSTAIQVGLPVHVSSLQFTAPGV